MERGTLAVLVLALLHGLAHLLLFAPWMGEDEPWHLEHATYVAGGELPGLGRGERLTHEDLEHHPLSQLLAKRRFPGVSYATIEETQTAILDAMAAQGFWRRVDWVPPNTRMRAFDQIEPGYTAVNQPPLHYVALGGWLRVLGGGTAAGRLGAGRVLSFLLYVATVMLAWRLGRAAFDDPASGLAVAFVALLAPIHARHAALVNNDVPATMLATLLLVLGAGVLVRVEQRPGAGRLAPLLGVLLVAALAALTKMTTAGIAALVVLVALVALVQGRSRWSWLVVAAAGLALLAGAALYWNQQHNPALPRGIATYMERVDEGLSFAGLYKLWGRFVGRLSWNSRSLPDGTYGAVALGLGLGLALALTTLVRPPAGVRRSVVLLCLAAAIAQLALVFLRGVPEGRYLTPALPALGVLVAAGFVARVPETLRRHALGALVLALLAFDATYLWKGVVLHHHLLWNG